MKTVSRFRALAALVLVTSVLPAAQAQDHGRFLPGAPNIGLNGFAWGREGVDSLTAPVEVGGRRVGEVRFDQDSFTGTTPRGTAAGGNALAGGFWLDRGVRLVPPCRPGWTQVVRSEVAGQNEWGAGRNQWFPDTNNGRTAPDYPGQRLPGGLQNPPNPPPTVGFQDFPTRFFPGGAQTWTAELALFVANDARHEICLIGIMTWGFTLTPGNPNVVRRLGPLAWTNGVAANSNLVTTLRDGFDGNGLAGARPPFNTSTPWTINVGDCSDCFAIPAPGSLALLAAAGLVARRRRAA